MRWKCVHCGASLEKAQPKQINGAVLHFCPTPYSVAAADCVSKYLREHRAEIYQYRDMAPVP